MKIAFIGTGVMGSSMVKNLLKNGHEVHVYNRTYAKAKTLEEEGAVAFEQCCDALVGAEVVITIVGYPKDVEEVFETIFTVCPKGTTVIDMTTSSPSLAKRLFEQGKEKGIEVLDAPVSGGDTGAQKGTLSIMVGGEKRVYDQVTPILRCMGTNLVYMGEAGSGQHTKMANQIAIAGTVCAVAEALVYAKNVGLKPEELLAAISAGAAGSWQLSNNGPKMIEGDVNPGFFIKHFIKDMKLAQDEAEQREFELPVLNLVEGLYEELAQQGCENEGTQAIIKAISAK